MFIDKVQLICEETINKLIIMGLIVDEIRKRWPGNCLVYKIGAAFTSEERARIRSALDSWKETGFVQYIEKSTQDRYVSFVQDSIPLDGICSSNSLGMSGGEQIIRLDPGASVSTIRHEIGHALGLYHEHKRRDRDRWIDWNEAKTKSIYRYQFLKVDLNEAQNVDAYDLDSLMHYGSAKSMSIDGNTPLIKTDNVANSGRIGSASISAGDIGSVKAMCKGNQHVYQISGSGQLETLVEQESWTSGWSIAIPYSVGPNKFLFLLKSSDGTMHVNKINFDGSIGERIQNLDWSSGWTHAVKYSVGLGNYLLLYKKDSGLVHINRIDADGKIGEIVEEGSTIGENWSYLARFQILFSNFMLFSNMNGDVHIYELTFEGKLGQRKHVQSFGNNYSITQPYNVLNSDYLFMLKKSDGIMKIRRINMDGSIGELIQERDWTSGWTTAIPFHIGLSSYLFLLKKGDGTFNINKINSDGKVGSIVDERILSDGWGTVAVYGVGLGTFSVLIKP